MTADANGALTGFRAVFLGPPGAGKGTQAKSLLRHGEILHISTGDMLREQVAAETELGGEAKRFMDGGDLVPDELIIAMVEERLSRPDANRAWILDGFPRTLPQAVTLDRSLGVSGSPLTHVVYFSVPHDALVGRLSGRRTCIDCGAIWNTVSKPTRNASVCDLCGGMLRQRPDDRPEAVEQRLGVYASETEPLLDYYRSVGTLVEVDASRPPESVSRDVFQVLKREVA